MSGSEMQGLLAIVGFLTQYLRGFSWFGDWATLLVSVLGSALATWLFAAEPLTAKAFVLAMINGVPTFLGGTMVATMASHQTGVVPKYNAYEREVKK